MKLPANNRVIGVILASSVGVALFGPLPAHAYRTFADDPAVGQPARLPTDTFSWAIAAPSATSEQLAEIEQAAAAAVSTWTTPPCGALRGFVVTSGTEGHAAPGDGISTIEVVQFGWGERGLESGRGATADVQLVVDGSGLATIAEADIYLDFEHFAWSDRGLGGGFLDTQAVLTHEIGHALGFLHSCEVESEPLCPADGGSGAMTPVYTGTEQRALTADDVEGLCSLYPARPCDPECAAGEACDQGSCRTVCLPSDPLCHGCVWPTCGGRPCEESADCGLDSCAVTGESEGYCLPDGVFGVECASGDECASGLCVRSRHASFCSATCTDNADCDGDGLVCRPVDGTTVCAYPPPASAGCASGGGRRPGPTWALCLCALATVTRLRRRRRNNGKGERDSE